MTNPIDCEYLPAAPTGPLTASDPPTDLTAWIDTHGCHALATWAIVTPGQAEATYACAAHLAELCYDGDTVRVVVVDREVGR